VLISSRVKGLLAGGHQVEVGLPSPSDSARMLLAAADAKDLAAHPAGVGEIVDLCGRLVRARPGRLSALSVYHRKNLLSMVVLYGRAGRSPPLFGGIRPEQPLALGIAGRLAASLGLVGAEDWSGMIGVLKEELRESHSGGVEEGIIRASLRGLGGSQKEQTNVRSLLLVFSLVPEDTHCPLEVLLLMFKAVNHGSGATVMHIRKWLR
jgi:hypothetical protein